MYVSPGRTIGAGVWSISAAPVCVGGAAGPPGSRRAGPGGQGTGAVRQRLPAGKSPGAGRCAGV